MSTPSVPYAGIATRAIALAVDVFLAQLLVLAGGGILTLIGSIVGDVRPQWLVTTLVAVGWFLTIALYLVLFWSLVGQTPGMRLMHLLVVDGRGRPPGFWRSVLRLIGLVLCIIPCFLGFVPELFDNRRRGCHDMLARTTVLYAGDAQPVRVALPPSGATTSWSRR